MKTGVCLWLAACGLTAAALAGPRPAKAACRYVEGEVIVTLRPDAGLRPAAAALGPGIAVRRHFHGLSRRRGKAFLVAARPGSSTAQLLAALAGHPQVENVSPNYLKPVNPVPLPSDTRFSELWGLHNLGQAVNGVSGTPDADIDFPEARALTRPAGPEVVVGIMDTGTDYEHGDLAAGMWVNPGEVPDNGADDDGNGYVDDVHGYDFAGDEDGDGVPGPPDADPMDRDNVYGHGTHVAGTVAAVTDNAKGVAGVFGGARLMALKCSADGNYVETAAEIAAIEYATDMRLRGVNVVALNASFGCSGCYSQAEKDAIADAGAAGIVFCAAAGNDGMNTDGSAYYPAGYNLANVIAVAATDSSDGLASFSNYGAVSVDLAAPGNDILSTRPVHMGTEAFVTGPDATYAALGMDFAGITTGFTGTLHDCGLGYPGDFPAAVSGQVALIERGVLYFTEKAQNAMAAGAAAAVIYNKNGEPGNFLGTLQFPNRWIPAVAVSRADGLALLELGTPTVTVVNREAVAYHFLGGTSMATPHVAGATALLAFCFGDETPARRIQRLRDSVDIVPALADKTATDGRLNLVRCLDTDADGLPDWWELDHAPDLNAMNGSTESDGDGMPDGAEFAAGTDPADPDSCLRIESVSPGAVARLHVVWKSVSNRVYTVRGGNGAAGDYSPLATGVAATPPLNTYTDTVHGVSRRFYRIELEP